MQRTSFIICFLVSALLLQSCTVSRPVQPDRSHEQGSTAAVEIAEPVPETGKAAGLIHDSDSGWTYVTEVLTCLTELPDRFAGSENNAAAADYIAGEMKRIGLEPFAGESYLQPYPQLVGGEEISLDNVVGYLRGTGSTNPDAVVISCHFDTVSNTPGAVDNASGVAAMLTTARLLVSMEVSDRPDLIFCAFNGEEQFYIGSQAFVESFKEIYESPYNINYDCVGMVNGGTYMMGAGEEDTAYELIRSMSQFLESGGILLNDYNNQSIRSDHVSFVKAGIPGVCLSMINVPSVIHSPNDTTDQVDAAEVAGLAAAVADYLDQSRMAGSE